MENFVSYLKSDPNASNQFIKGVMKQNWSNEEYWESVLPMLDFSDPRVEKYVHDNIGDFRPGYLIKYAHCLSTGIIDLIVSEGFVEEQEDLENLIQYQKLTPGQLNQVIGLGNPSKLVELAQEFQQVSEEFIEKYNPEISWDLISENQFMDLKFLLKYKSKLNWELIACNQHLQPIFNESFLILFADTNIWDGIGWMEQIPLDLINKYQDKLTAKSHKSIQLAREAHSL